MRSALTALVLALALAAWSPALADVISLEVSECQYRDAGRACTVRGKEGACVETTCSRTWSGFDENGERTSHTVSDPCMVCDPDATPTLQPSTLVLPIAGAVLGALAIVALVVWQRRRRSKAS